MRKAIASEKNPPLFESLCDYKTSSRKEALSKTVANQLYQLFELLDTALIENLSEVHISYKATIRDNTFKPVALPNLVNIALDDIEQNGDSGFTMQLSIYCYREFKDDVQLWGTTTYIEYHEPPHKEINLLDNSRPYIEIEKERLPLCEQYTILQKRRILNSIMFRIINDYDKHYS